MHKEGDVSMQDIVDILRGLPPLKSTILIYGHPAKVTGYHITVDAAYVVLDNGQRLEQTVHKDNLKRLQNADSCQDIKQEGENGEDRISNKYVSGMDARG